jgi:hypothetical protein
LERERDGAAGKRKGEGGVDGKEERKKKRRATGKMERERGVGKGRF